MTQQPEALRLADALEDAGKPTFITDEAAAELRRLHEVEQEDGKRIDRLEAKNDDLIDRIAALEKALGLAVEALEPLIHRAAPWGEQDWLDGKAALTTARQTLGGKHD